MLKLYFKTKKYLKSRGFTLVELLAVIVILAIIMLIAIPAVLSTLESARIKTFTEYVDKSAGLAQKQLAENQMNGNMASACVIYNIKTDLGLSNTGTFEGWVLIDSKTSDIFITLFNEDYGLSAFHYNDSSIKVEEYLSKRSSFSVEELTIEYLCGNSTCSTCSYVENNEGKEVSNEEYQKKNGAFLVTGTNFAKKIKEIANGRNLEKFKVSSSIPDGIDKVEVSLDTSPYKAWLYVQDDNLYLYSDSKGKIFLNPDSSGLFSSYKTDVSTFQSIDMTGLDSSMVNNMSTMFQKSTSLTNLNISDLDTSKVTEFVQMFENCTILENIDISHFNTSRATNMSSMFQGCESLISLDLSNFDTRNVTEMGAMFYKCKSITNLDVSNFDVSKVEGMYMMFDDMSNVESLNIGNNFNSINVTNMGYMFSGLHKLKTLDISGIKTNKLKSTLSMFSASNLIERLYFNDEFDTTDVTNMSYMFNNMEKLKEIHFGNKFNTSNVTNMDHMFYNVESISTLDLSQFNTSKVTNMQAMFCTCDALTNINLTSFDTSKVTNISNMFWFCDKLNEIDLSSFDTSSLKNSSGMFTYCKQLETIFISNKWNLNNATNTSGMFEGCKKLPYFNESIIDGSKAYAGEGGYLTLKV